MFVLFCFARIVRSTRFCAICAKTDLFDDDRDSFYHRARKSTYLQYPEKEKSLSATKYEKNAENCR